MAKDEMKDEVKMIKVVRAGGLSNGGPTEATIPETSLPSWLPNGWRPVEKGW